MFGEIAPAPVIQGFPVHDHKGVVFFIALQVQRPGNLLPSGSFLPEDHQGVIRGGKGGKAVFQVSDGTAEGEKTAGKDLFTFRRVIDADAGLGGTKRNLGRLIPEEIKLLSPEFKTGGGDGVEHGTFLMIKKVIAVIRDL